MQQIVQLRSVSSETSRYYCASKHHRGWPAHEDNNKQLSPSRLPRTIPQPLDNPWIFPGRCEIPRHFQDFRDNRPLVLNR